MGKADFDYMAGKHEGSPPEGIAPWIGSSANAQEVAAPTSCRLDIHSRRTRVSMDHQAEEVQSSGSRKAEESFRLGGELGPLCGISSSVMTKSRSLPKTEPSGGIPQRSM